MQRTTRFSLLTGAGLGTLLLAGGLAVVPVGGPTASSVSPLCASPTPLQVARQVTRVREAHGSQAQIATSLASRFCLKHLGRFPTMTPVADSTKGPSFTPPQIFEETEGKGDYYYSVGQWSWSTHDVDTTIADEAAASSQGFTILNHTYNIGGPDGVATNYDTALVQKVNNGPTAASWFGNGSYFADGSSSSYAANNAHGTGFAIQDKFRTWLNSNHVAKADFNMQNGEIVTEFYGTKSGKCETGVAGWMHYGHTYDKASVGESFTIDAGGPGVDFHYTDKSHSLPPDVSGQSQPKRVCYKGPDA
jgi:hypothetical protein